jgi:hypothetical protein
VAIVNGAAAFEVGRDSGCPEGVATGPGWQIRMDCPAFHYTPCVLSGQPSCRVICVLTTSSSRQPGMD